MKEYMHIPTVVEAVQFTGAESGLLPEDIRKFIIASGVAYHVTPLGIEPNLEFVLNLKTVNGWQAARPGYWLVRDKLHPEELVIYQPTAFSEGFEECNTKSMSPSSPTKPAKKSSSKPAIN